MYKQHTPQGKTVMNHSLQVIALLAAVVTVAALAGGAAAAVPSDAGEVAQLNTTERNATAPGAQLAGIVGVQQTEVTGDLDNRSFGIRIANADSDEERAAIIAERQAETSQQVATETERLADLRAARDGGTITTSEYRARVAIVASQAATAERTADQLNRTARELPPAVRERNGINVTAIDRLRTDARNLSGPETAAIARSIGGTTARNPLAGTRGPSDRGPETRPAGTAGGPDQPSSAGAGSTTGDDNDTSASDRNDATDGRNVSDDTATDSRSAGDDTNDSPDTDPDGSSNTGGGSSDAGGSNAGGDNSGGGASTSGSNTAGDSNRP